MKKTLLLIGLVAVYVVWSMSSVTTPPPATERQPARPATKAPRANTGDPSGCVPHVELHSAEYWARELGRPVPMVLSEHRINLWQRAAEDRGPKVGEMLVGSRAVILAERGEYYRVRSPLDGSVGWVNEIQVASVVHANTETREICTP